MKLILNEQQALLYSLVKENEQIEHMKKLLKYGKSSNNMGQERKVCFDFLFELQKSNVVNMFGAPPFLINGKDWLFHYIKTQGKNPSAYKMMLEKADAARFAVISIAMRNYDDAHPETEDDERVLSWISREMRRVSEDVFRLWMYNYKRQKERLRPNGVRSADTNVEDNETHEITCSECGHSWEYTDDEDDKLLCKNCYFDQETQEYR